MSKLAGIPLKKYLGQHFLREDWVLDKILGAVKLTSTDSIFEIGCGDGFLTKKILKNELARLWVFEIDPDWANYVEENLAYDHRLKIHLKNILDIDFSIFDLHTPWTLLANLPYQITFPILHLLQKNRNLLKKV